MLFFISGRMCSALQRSFLLICSETSFWKTALKKKTHVSKRVQVVVGQFELLEGDELAAPVRSGGGGVRVDVKPPGHRGLCLPRHRPARHTHTQINSQQMKTHNPVTEVCLSRNAPSGAPWRSRPSAE